MQVERHMTDALSKGAEILVGGKRLAVSDAPAGHFYAPTVLTKATPVRFVEAVNLFRAESCRIC